MIEHEYEIKLVNNNDGTGLAHYETSIGDLPNSLYPIIHKSGSHGNVIEELKEEVKVAVEMAYKAPGRVFIQSEHYRQATWDRFGKFIVRVYEIKDFVVLDKRITDLEDKIKELDKEVALLNIKEL